MMNLKLITNFITKIKFKIFQWKKIQMKIRTKIITINNTYKKINKKLEPKLI